MAERSPEFIASSASVGDGSVQLVLLDGSVHAFPIHYYPRLRAASLAQLAKLELRVGGRALRWEELDEDIWIADAILQRYPTSVTTCVSEPPPEYRV